MLAAERQHTILDHVDQNRSAKVTELAALLNVTEETIRRDLEKLEGEGLLRRQHGGAISLRCIPRELSFTERERQLTDEKRRIAQTALQFVQEGDTLMLDASTTALQMGRMLPPLRLTVVTNSFHLVSVLAPRSDIDIILIGGLLSKSSMSFLGPASEKQLSGFFVDKLFLSCRGVGLDTGASDANHLEASLKRQMMLRSREHYLLADSSKFNVQSLNIFAELQEFNSIITDQKMEEGMLERLNRSGYSLITA